MSDPSNLEHLDEVVSAYVDGEATPEEVRLVEGDPALIERARLLTDLVAMDQVVPEPNAAMKQRHLSAAMAAFEAPGKTSAASTVDLTAAAAPADHPQENDAAPVIDLTSRRRGPAGLPRWLSAAAGTLVVLGGIGFVINQNGASEDSAATDTAESADVISNSRPEEEGDSAGAAQAMDTDAMDDEAMEDDSEAMSDDAGADESIPTTTFADVAGEEAMEEAEGDVDSEAADTEAADTDDAAETPNPAIDIAGDVTIDDLLLIIEDLEGMPLAAATCADGFTSSIRDVEDRVGPFNADGSAVEVFSLLIDGQINEFFVVNTIDGEHDGVLFGPDCTMIDR